MEKVIFECVYCDALLTEYNTQDWDAEGGACDKCCEYRADAYQVRQDLLEDAREAYRTGN